MMLSMFGWPKMRFLEIVELTTEEMEAYRLRHINDLKQKKKPLKKCAPHKAHIKDFIFSLQKNC